MILNSAITFEGLTTPTDRCLIIHMKEIKQIRLENLHLLLNTKFGGVKASLARGIKKDVNQTRFLLHPEKSGGRWLGEKQAREIEAVLKLDSGWLDINRSEEGDDTVSGINDDITGLTVMQSKILALIDVLPQSEQLKLLDEIKDRANYFKKIFDEMDSKRTRKKDDEGFDRRKKQAHYCGIDKRSH